MYSCCCGFYVTTTTKDNGEGEFAALLEIGNVFLLLDDFPLEEPPEIEDDVKRGRVEIDVPLQVTQNQGDTATTDRMWGSSGSRSVISFSVTKRKKVTNMQWRKKECGWSSTSSTSVVRTRSMSFVRGGFADLQRDRERISRGREGWGEENP